MGVWVIARGTVLVLRATAVVVSVVTTRVVLLRCLLRALQVIAVVVTGVASGTRRILSRMDMHVVILERTRGLLHLQVPYRVILRVVVSCSRWRSKPLRMMLTL